MDNKKTLKIAGKILGYGAAAGIGGVAIGMNKLDRWSAKIAEPKPPPEQVQVINPDEIGDIWPNPDPAVAALEAKCFRNPKLMAV